MVKARFKDIIANRIIGLAQITSDSTITAKGAITSTSTGIFSGLRIGTLAVPAAATVLGSPGEIRCDGTRLYYCISSGTWVNSATLGAF